jgi:hypothetical protein
MEDLEQELLQKGTRNCSQMVKRHAFKSRKERLQEDEGANQKEQRLAPIQKGEVLPVPGANLRQRRGESKEQAQEEGQIGEFQRMDAAILEYPIRY